MEYKTYISLLLISLVLAFGADWIIKRIQKYFDDKELQRYEKIRKFYYKNIKPPETPVFPDFKILRRYSFIERQNKIAKCRRKHNHKTASNSRKIRGRANG